MRRLKRWLGVADELAGVLIFDVILGTRAGRRAVAAAGLAGAVGVWALSGLVMAPGPIPHPSVGDGAPPYFERWHESGENAIVSAVLERKSIRSEELGPLKRYLARNREALDRAVELTHQRSLVTAHREPRYRDLRMMANALAARGYVYARMGDSERALRDWLATMRLGRAMAWGAPPAGPSLLSLMIGNAIQRSGVKALQAHVAGLSSGQLRFLAGQLALREVEMPALTLALGSEAEQARRMVEEFGRTGRWPEFVPRQALDMWLPWRESARVEAAGELSASLAKAYAESISAVKAGVWPQDPPEVADFAPVSILWGIFSRSHGVEMASRLVQACVMPNVRAAGERLKQCEKEARDLEEAVDARLAWE